MNYNPHDDVLKISYSPLSDKRKGDWLITRYYTGEPVSRHRTWERACRAAGVYETVGPRD